MLGSDPIGGGGHADIFSARYDEQLVALKRFRTFCIPKERAKFHRSFLKEALLWRQLKHDHILQLIGIDEDSFRPLPCMVSAWMPNGTIVDYVSTLLDPVTAIEDINELLRQVISGIAYLHGEDIVHGDLKGANVLIGENKQVRLSDFGLADLIDMLNGDSTTGRGSARWMAPELHFPEQFMLTFRRTTSSDMYAFGFVCLEVFSGHVPFHWIRQDSNIVLRVVQGERPPRPTRDECHGREMPDDMWNLITSCWEHYPEHRPCASTVDAALSAARNQSIALRPSSAPVPAMPVGDTLDQDTVHTSCCDITFDDERFARHIADHHKQSSAAGLPEVQGTMTSADPLKPAHKSRNKKNR
ncbi:kinase-like protein [Punctularia strigosozonata HHB-11173 SS5]|uniref:kinase-like protein n=1 Tax=Punctularia strigosozonata (strain HHB-11173) TaxID=741275 RepID=UPI0004417D96|nr:kinase-like protein [Punctularia strigosozonata HHB-11173 SS5]EIN11550.1 kinase-like protein [Punctularia strigosozonata HHB-11173 SS5]